MQQILYLAKECRNFKALLVWEVSASATIMKKRLPLLPVAELTSTFAILIKFCFVIFASGTQMIIGVLLVFSNFSVMFTRKTGYFCTLLGEKRFSAI